jgi:UrcA family protein
MSYQPWTVPALTRLGPHVVVAVLPLLSLLLPAAALAQPAAASNLPSVVVHYEDINLSTESGAKVLLRRLESAARWVCGDHGEHIALVDLEPLDRCYAQKLAQAVSAVGSERLMSLYRKKHGRMSTYAANRQRR